MKLALVIVLTVAVVCIPLEAQAQHGHGGGGGMGRGGGGNWGGGGFGRGGGGGGAGGGGGWNGGGRQGGGGGANGGSGGGGGRQGGAPGGARTASANHGGRPGNFQQHAFNHGPNHFSHRPGYHGHWYHGDWHGHWAHPWAYRPWGWYGGWGWGFGIGFTAGAVVAYGSPWYWGYYNYWNPYWAGPVGGVTYINYSQPIVYAPPVAQAAPGALPGPSDATAAPGQAGQPGQPAALTKSQETALATFDSARSFFKRGDYTMALAQANRSVALVPNDTLMHEFRALCLFATKDYQQSAAALYAVLSVGPGWDMATVNGLYSNPQTYADQLRALEQYCQENSQTPAPRFVLAYHYMLGGKNDQAAAELQAVVKLEPKDQLSAQLLKGLTTPDQQPASQPVETPAAPISPSDLVGNWKASREDGSKFELNLTQDNKFNWKFDTPNKKQTLNGTYTFANNYLILSATGQNALVGRVALDDKDQLKFRLADGSPADPGLTFTR